MAENVGSDLCNILRQNFLKGVVVKRPNSKSGRRCRSLGEVAIHSQSEFRRIVIVDDEDWAGVIAKLGRSRGPQFKLFWSKQPEAVTRVMRLHNAIVLVHSGYVSVRWTFDALPNVPSEIPFGDRINNEKWSEYVMQPGDALVLSPYCHVQLVGLDQESCWSLCRAVDNRNVADDSEIDELVNNSGGNVRVLQLSSVQDVDWTSADVQHIRQVTSDVGGRALANMKSLRKCLSRAAVEHKSGEIVILNSTQDMASTAMKNRDPVHHKIQAKGARSLINGQRRCGYWLVDFDTYDQYCDVFDDDNGPPCELVRDICVLVSESRTISTVHKDPSHSILFLLAGAKTFRFHLWRSQTKPAESVFNVRGPCSPPENWFDVVLLPGDAVVVPAEVFHDVESERGTIALSMVIDCAKPLIGQTEHRDVQVRCTSDGASMEYSNDECRRMSPDTSVAIPENESHNEPQINEDCASVSAVLAAQPCGVKIISDYQGAVDAVVNLHHLLFTERMTLLPRVLETTGFERLFGKAEESVESSSSGRIMFDMTLMEGDDFDDIVRAYRVTISAVMQCLGDLVGKKCADKYTVDAVFMILRPTFPLESQSLHLDAFQGNCPGSLLTILVPMNDHAGTVFADLTGPFDSNSTIKTLHPLVKQGALLIFDQSCTPHYGGPVLDPNEHHLFSALLFLRLRLLSA
jgi:hypothetical protein